MASAYRTAYKRVGSVVKTVGLYGEVVVEVTDGLSDYIVPGMEARFVPPLLDGPNRATIDFADPSDTGVCLAFEEITTLDEASLLVGRHVLLRRDELEYDEQPDQLMGRTVVCVDHGELGQVTELIVTPANDVLVVDGGAFGEVLIPAIDECILDVPEDPEEPIMVKLLPGLVDAEADYVHPDEETKGGE